MKNTDMIIGARCFAATHLAINCWTLRANSLGFWISSSLGLYTGINSISTNVWNWARVRHTRTRTLGPWRRKDKLKMRRGRNKNIWNFKWWDYGIDSIFCRKGKFNENSYGIEIYLRFYENFFQIFFRLILYHNIFTLPRPRASVNFVWIPNQNRLNTLTWVKRSRLELN